MFCCANLYKGEQTEFSCLSFWSGSAGQLVSACPFGSCCRVTSSGLQRKHVVVRGIAAPFEEGFSCYVEAENGLGESRERGERRREMGQRPLEVCWRRGSGAHEEARAKSACLTKAAGSSARGRHRESLSVPASQPAVAAEDKAAWQGGGRAAFLQAPAPRALLDLRLCTSLQPCAALHSLRRLMSAANDVWDARRVQRTAWPSGDTARFPQHRSLPSGCVVS